MPKVKSRRRQRRQYQLHPYKTPEMLEREDMEREAQEDHEYFKGFTRPGHTGDISFSDLTDLPDDHSTLVDDREYMPSRPWRKYFSEKSTRPSKAKRFNGSRSLKALTPKQHFNLQTYTFGLGDRSDEVNLYRSTKMSMVKRLKKLRGEKNFLDVETYTPQFSRGFISGALDSRKTVYLHPDVTDESTFEGRTRKNAKRQVGTSVLGRETLTFLKAGYRPMLAEIDVPKPGGRGTVKKQLFSLVPPRKPSVSSESVGRIWDMEQQNPSIELGGRRIYATAPKSPKTNEISLSAYFREHLTS